MQPSSNSVFWSPLDLGLPIYGKSVEGHYTKRPIEQLDLLPNLYESREYGVSSYEY
jgi:hypothetical protein